LNTFKYLPAPKRAGYVNEGIFATQLMQDLTEKQAIDKLIIDFGGVLERSNRTVLSTRRPLAASGSAHAA
jgi:hypothetical protein